MAVTSTSLIDRLRRAPSDSDWRRLHDVYERLIRGWLARVPGLGVEIDDLTQEVLVVVFREIANFERQREGSFRAWLRRVTVNRIREYWRKKARQPIVGFDGSATEDFLVRLEDPASALASQWDREHDKEVFDRLLTAVRGDFQPETWAAFKRFALDGVPAAQVAAELGITQNAVLLAKSRVMRRLRDEAGILLD
jgi:RNA polymerase sigma-70 factor (ECF subfamily)